MKYQPFSKKSRHKSGIASCAPTKYDVFFHSPYLPIPIIYIALMTAILPFLSSVNGKYLPTPRTSYLINRLTLNLVEMLVPPYITALVAAKLLFLSMRSLLYRHAAVFAINTVCYRSKTALLTTLAKRLDCVEIQPKLLRNTAVRHALLSQCDDLYFLGFRHRNHSLRLHISL